MDATKLARKVRRDVDYWCDLTLTTQTIAKFTELRYPVHQRAYPWLLLALRFPDPADQGKQYCR